MHTNRLGVTTFLYNGDYSGEIYVVGREKDTGATVHVQTNMKDLVSFVMEALRGEVVSAAEGASFRELLKMAAHTGISFPGLR